MIARSPLAGGYLAERNLAKGVGALRDHRHDSRVAVNARALWPQFADVARTRSVSTAQLALAWVLAHRQIDSVLVSVRSAGQLRELIDATSLRLAEADVLRLAGRAAPIASAAVATAPAPRYLPD